MDVLILWNLSSCHDGFKGLLASVIQTHPLPRYLRESLTMVKLQPALKATPAGIERQDAYVLESLPGANLFHQVKKMQKAGRAPVKRHQPDGKTVAINQEKLLQILGEIDKKSSTQGHIQEGEKSIKSFP